MLLSALMVCQYVDRICATLMGYMGTCCASLMGYMGTCCATLMGYMGTYMYTPTYTTAVMTSLQVADGADGLQIWRAAANILNKQLRTADKRWSSSSEVGRGANNPLL